ncbi:coiled-coil and C2 domain-containing protein 1-like isoform X2 [Cimex lectularius]|uniref:C2 domain-containing protein n=1 Tax=Cimex lectularius TaxID=79782 RepID=A0A8I6RQ85_CIMLE|nr:coiled-coil and C2 domain-containing protein 1-like isoform X2 [Cimex lectularius]
MNKSRAPKKPRSAGSNIDQLGIFAMPDFEGDDDGEEVDDDLEAELDAILNTGGGRPKPKPKRDSLLSLLNEDTIDVASGSICFQLSQVPSNLEKMVAESLRDIPSDEELSGDENDPELLAEFNSVLGEEPVDKPEEKPQVMAPTFQSQDFVKIITERIEMYKQAENNAKTVGDVSKGRRLARGLKTLQDLLQKAKSGFAIKESDIPLPVSVTALKPKVEDPPQLFEPLPIDGDGSVDSSVNSQPLSPVDSNEAPLIDLKDNSPTSENTELLNTLSERKEQYKIAAVVAKKNGDVQTALCYVKIVKQFDNVIAAVKSGHTVDLSNMPGPLTSQQMSPQPNINEAPTPAVPKVHSEPEPVSEQPSESEAPEGPKVPETILEALEQRLAKFKESEEAGKKDGNASKVRRIGRIIKQYEDAIRLHKAGKPFPVEDLPTPPGFAPIPVGPPAAPVAPAVPSSPHPSKTSISIPHPSIMDTPVPPVAPKSPVPTPKAHRAAPPPPVSPVAPSTSSHGGSVTRQEKQLTILKLKQKQFKEAAIKAKQNGNIELAKELLRKMKNFDPLIEATISGLPVDMSTLPAPPGSQDSIEKEFEVINLSDLPIGTTSEIYNQLITDLQIQIKTCMETRAHYKAMGEVANANRFENLAVDTKKDLDTVKIACNKDDPVPRFHYEMRTFSIVRCNIDLTDNDLELTIMQGINYNVLNPKEIDTYVRYEFPYPTDDPKKDKTSTVYNTNNPVYDTVVMLAIQRTNRACQRLFKRHSIKLEVWSKGGFLRSDVLIGTVNVKLFPLETKCTIHDSFDLMNGKKVVGGKLEVKIRLRHPIIAKQVEQVREKWLVID